MEEWKNMNTKRLFRKWKYQRPKKNESLEMKIRRLEIDVEAYHGEAIKAREEVRTMKQAMRDMRGEIARLSNKAQYEIADLESWR